VFGESEKSEMKVCRSIIFSQHFKVPGRMTSEKKTIQALSLVSTSVFGMPKKEQPTTFVLAFAMTVKYHFDVKLLHTLHVYSTSRKILQNHMNQKYTALLPA
jgi:hypothetical protein